MLCRSRSVWVILLVFFDSSAFAQGAGATGGINAPSAREGSTTGYMSQGDVKGLADFVDTTSQLQRKDLVSDALAGKHSAAILQALQVPCQLLQARNIASGRSIVDGRPAAIALYEVACANGMGYLLSMRDSASASGISCLAAAATEAVTSAEQNKIDTHCRLPANENLATMATTLLRNAGTACEARDVKWLGQSANPKVDYTEVACSDQRSFVLRTPVPGGAGENIDAISCATAATHGAKCQMSTSSPAVAAASASEARPSLQWFKDALQKNGVACEVEQARILGRESIKRRYIVEYQCPQQPRGVVAYVPSEGDTTHPFEWIDCNAAVLRQLACQFTGPGQSVQ